MTPGVTSLRSCSGGNFVCIVQLVHGPQSSSPTGMSNTETSEMP